MTDVTHIAQAGNTVVPAILALEAKGLSVATRDGVFVATSPDGATHVADDPVAVLGLVALVEIRGNHWRATDEEIDATLPMPSGPDAQGSDELVRDPYVTLFWSPRVLDEAIDRLAAQGYDVRTADAASWSDVSDMHRALASLLDFPEYYGHNLDALNDCLSDVAEGQYGARPEAEGLVLVLQNYERFAAVSASVAFAVLDIFASRARTAALCGRPMLCLVQSNDPQLAFPDVGAAPVEWNSAEWLDARRGL